MCRRKHHLSAWCLSVCLPPGVHSHLGHSCVPFTVQMVQIDLNKKLGYTVDTLVTPLNP